jgi:PAS domain S-box-containing protein
LALIIFFPSSELGPQVDLRKERSQIRSLVDQIKVIQADYHADNRPQISPFARLNDLFADQTRILQAAILLVDSTNPRNYHDYYRYIRDDENAEFAAPDFAAAFESEIARNELQMPDDVLMPVFYSSDEALLRYSFHLDDSTPAMLVVAAEHNLIITPRFDLIYTITLLFLFTTLVSLLTVYLISRRFQQPLRHLLRGLEKTAEGEMYYMVEAEGDAEISKLANSFNRMTGTLLENSQQINRYNRRLKSTNRRLVQSRHFLSSLIDASPFGIITVSPEGQIMTFNKRAARDFGIPTENIIGRNVDQLFQNPITSELEEGKIGMEGASFEVLCLRDDRSCFPAYLKIQPIFGRSEDQTIVPAYLLIVRDISESKSFQEMMIRLDRYYTRGEMAGDIAHEINNFLAILSGNVELMPLMIRKGDTEKIEKKLALMRTTVERIACFTDGLMDANMGEVHFEMIDLNQYSMATDTLPAEIWFNL